MYTGEIDDCPFAIVFFTYSYIFPQMLFISTMELS